MKTGALSVVILTFNEELNLPFALRSVVGWAEQVFVLDSGSIDRTREFAESFGCHVVVNDFVDYSKQRNFALDNLPIRTEWVMFLDADEWVPDDLKDEISRLLLTDPRENGFFINRRLIWMGRWIKHGYYPSWILRLFRRGKGRCEDRAVNEHMIVEGELAALKNDFIHEDRRGASDWIAKHNSYATKEALEMVVQQRETGYREIDARLFGTQAERKRWVRYKLWNRMPLLVRPFAHFFHRYVLLGGFLDGKEGFIYHFLHGLWFVFLIDVKCIELAGEEGARGRVESEAGDHVVKE